jgi:DNA-binding transcriptional MerR regulator/methylmalonyl-CoA mutase cobalamin-binding subunit
MNDRSNPSILTLSIAAVERDTGLSKDTLRVWERRYDFPNPTRDGGGERAYPLDQVERLRVIKRLLDAGHRPGRIVRMPHEALLQLAEAAGEPEPAGKPDWDEAAVQEYLALLRAHDLPTLRRQLQRDLARVGLPRFLVGLLVPLNRAVGEAWLRGQMEVFEEHVFTELLQTLIRQAIAALPPLPEASPRVLLTTLPGEPHGLGLLMVEALLCNDGAACVPLGVQTPVWDVVLAAGAFRCDVVAVGFSGCTNPNQTVEALQELRGKLPAETALWVGGNAPVLQRRRIEGTRVFDDLESVSGAVAEWRAARG